MFVIRLRGTDLFFPIVDGRPPMVFETQQQAKRKVRYEFSREDRERWEVVPYEAHRDTNGLFRSATG